MEDSPHSFNLEEVNAGDLAQTIIKHASDSANEEELKIRVESTLRPILSKWGIQWASYERRLEVSGREDALYGRVIIEYKTPGTLSSATEFKKVKAQVKDYIEKEGKEKDDYSKYCGVTFDGFNISFVRYRNGKWDEQNQPLKVNGQTVLKLLASLRGLRRRPLDAQFLLRDFGPKSETSRKVILTLYDSLSGRTTPRTQMLFNDWKRVFSQVCSYSIDKLGGLVAYYDLDGKVDVEKLLFSVHTYYTILMKLLTSEIVTLFADSLLGSYLKRVEEAYYRSHKEMLGEFTDMEEGGIFATIGIKNFLEADYFAWYLDEWDEKIAAGIHEIATKLLDYEPATVELNPERVKDLFKQLYQNLVPGKSAGEKADVRGKLGEFYTPDWLAELLIEQIGYDGNPDKRILDPACGSGTFLVMAIKKIREYAEEHFLDERTLISKIIDNVRGIDLNPLAVLASKANYLIALSDLLRYRPRDGIDIPVYLADSISVIRKATPYGDDEYELNTNEGRFWVTKEVIDKNCLYPLLSIVAEGVKIGLTKEQFQTSVSRSIPLTAHSVSSFQRLYDKILKLEKLGKNRIWTSLLKNSFSPMLIGKFDFVIGNPPWINWESLPDFYRDSTKHLWEDYGLLETSQGAIKQDISMLFVVRCLDLYCAENGRLGFLVPFTLFKTKSGSGFRNRIAQKYNVTRAEDLVELYPFEGATNRSALLVVGKGKTALPVSCRMWMNPSGTRIDQEMPLQEVIKSTKQYPTILTPIDPKDFGSAWMEVSTAIHEVLRKVMAPSSYKAYAGIYTGADGIFLVKSLRADSDKSIVENLAKTAKKEEKKVTAAVETKLLYPIVRGKDVKRWFLQPELSIIVPHDPVTSKAHSDSKMKLDFPLTYRYLLSFKQPLEKRTIKPFLGGKKDTLPFYMLDNMGERTFSKYKVAWKHISGKVSGKAVLDCMVLSPNEEGQIVLPTHGLMYIPVKKEDEAYFMCAILNSSIAHLVVMSYALEVHVTTDVTKYVFVPDYDPQDEIHKELSKLSKEAHSVAKSYYTQDNNTEQTRKLVAIEKSIDGLVGKLYGLTAKEHDEVLQSLQILENGE